MDNVALEWCRSLGDIHFRKVTLTGEPAIPITSLMVTEPAMARLCVRENAWDPNPDDTQLKQLVSAFAFDSEQKNRERLDMVLRDCPEHEACIWLTPGEDCAHVLLWGECRNVNTEEKVRRYWEKQHSE